MPVAYSSSSMATSRAAVGVPAFGGDRQRLGEHGRRVGALEGGRQRPNPPG